MGRSIIVSKWCCFGLIRLYENVLSDIPENKLREKVTNDMLYT